MKRFRKVYLEITNVCNLACSFCPGTSRPKAFLQEDAFRRILAEITPYTDYVYFHLMGEPLLHPQLADYLRLTAEAGLHPCLTTNGTMLASRGETLLQAPPIHKISISLQAQEANTASRLPDSYLDDCLRFGKTYEGKGVLVYRLWNEGGLDQNNAAVLEKLKEFFPEPWVLRPDGYRIGKLVYLEYGKTFTWPDAAATGTQEGRFFCYALRDQLGVLCDGTVVPCCLDHNGDLALGNVLQQPLEEILASPRAEALYNGFSAGSAVEPLCRTCGFIRRFRG